MDKQQLDNLWQLYREFCLMCNQSDMVNTTAEFLAWIERFKLDKTTTSIIDISMRPKCFRCANGETCIHQEK